MITRYRARVYRDGPWCMVAIPELAGLTQALRPSDAADEARSYIATATGHDLANIAVDVTEIEHAGTA